MRIRTTAWLIAAALVSGLVGCEIEQHDEAEPPQVEVQEGQVPPTEAETDGVEVQPDTLTVPEVETERPQ